MMTVKHTHTHKHQGSLFKHLTVSSIQINGPRMFSRKRERWRTYSNMAEQDVQNDKEQREEGGERGRSVSVCVYRSQYWFPLSLFIKQGYIASVSKCANERPVKESECQKIWKRIRAALSLPVCLYVHYNTKVFTTQ